MKHRKTYQRWHWTLLYQIPANMEKVVTTDHLTPNPIAYVSVNLGLPIIVNGVAREHKQQLIGHARQKGHQTPC